MSSDLDAPILLRPAPAALRLDLAAAAIGRRLVSIAPLIVLVVAWEFAARSGAISSFLLPPLSAVLERVWDDTVSGDLFRQSRPDPLPLAGRVCDRRGGGHRARHPDDAATVDALVFRPDHLGRLSDAEDRISADLHAVARALRRLEDLDDGVQRDLSGHHRDDGGGRGRRDGTCCGRPAASAPASASCCARSSCRRQCRKS